MRRVARLGAVAFCLVWLGLYVAWNWDGGCAGLEGRSESSHLLVLDDAGFALPVGNLDLQSAADWRLEFRDLATNASKTLGGTSDVEAFKRIKFRCAGTDITTAGAVLRIIADGRVVFESDVVPGAFGGLQDQRLGFAEPTGFGWLRFVWMMRSVGT